MWLHASRLSPKASLEKLWLVDAGRHVDVGREATGYRQKAKGETHLEPDLLRFQPVNIQHFHIK